MKLLLRSDFACFCLGLWIFLIVPSVFAEEALKETTKSSSKTAAAVAKESEKVPVELEWEEVPEAKLYELEFQNFEGKALNVFKSENHIFKFRFKVGKYKVRSRVADYRKVYGDWSQLTEFTVQPKPVKLTEKSVSTKGIIDPKTLTTEVSIHWGKAAGATDFRVKVMNANAEVVRDEIVKGLYYKTQLGAGEYTTVLISIGGDGIESDPVPLPGKVVIETVQLEKPVIVFEEVPDAKNPKVKIQRLPLSKGIPTLRWKEASTMIDRVGTLEYRYFFGEEWIPIDKFSSKNAKEIILEKAAKPGRYRINAWAESRGLRKSEVTSYEFVVKPTAY
jgi:hypothetical protein